MAGVPVIIHTMHGLAFHERSPHCARLFYSILERFAAGRCDRIVSVSEFHRRWAIDLRICKAWKILTIPNGIADKGLPHAAPPALRSRLGVSPKEIMILTMARLVPEKGLEYLIEAAAQLRLAAPQCKTVIAGDGPARCRLERLMWELGVSDRVTFLGYRQDVDELLAACDLIVLPSLREGLSISLLEAMAAGKPIVASRIGSHVEVLSQANTAKLVTPADVRALSDAILDLICDQEMMIRLGTNARRQFELGYTEGRMLSAYCDLYRSLLHTNLAAKAA
jgi:glycosyltransferase involved in cell wall biosynthesis